MSAGMCQGSVLCFPMQLFSPAATMMEMVMVRFSDGHRGFDGRVRIVVFHCEIFKPEVENIADGRVELQYRQRPRRARELQEGLVEMVLVQVHIAEGMDELA